MAKKRTAEQKTTVKDELVEAKEELRKQKKSCEALEYENKGLEVRVVALDGQLEEAERQKSIFKDQAAKLEGKLSAVEEGLKWEKNEYRVREAELEGKIEGMERAMKILSRRGRSKRRRNS